MANAAAQRRQLVPFAALSATYFAHIGFFNPYLPLWLQSMGLSLVAISLLGSVQGATRVFAPYAWGWLSDHTGERVRLMRFASVVALVSACLLFLPLDGVLVAPGDWRVIFYDGSIQQVNVIPISETPLGFILSKQVVLAGDVTVESIQERGPALDLTLYRTAAPDQGRVKLTLATDPMLLRSWAVTDAQGLTTTIALEDVQTGIPLDRELFRWRDPKMFGWPKD